MFDRRSISVLKMVHSLFVALSSSLWKLSLNELISAFDDLLITLQ